MVSHNHTHMRFPIPRGSYMSNDMVIVVWVGGQSSANSAEEANPRISFVFDPPRLYGIKNFERDPEDCEDVDRCFNTYDAETRSYTRHCRKAPAECYDTIGQFYLELVGESFGTEGDVSVRVGEWDCPMAANNEIPGRVGSHSHFRLVCRAPAGYGDNLPVTVSVNGRSSQDDRIEYVPDSSDPSGSRMVVVEEAPEPPIFAYDPPVVMAVQSSEPDADGDEVRIRGKNFGGEPTLVEITIGGLECIEPQWLNDGLLQCQAQRDRVGLKNMTILAANRTEPYVIYEYEELVFFQCSKDFYGLVGEYCVNCEEERIGAVCPGGESFEDLVTSDEGFWRLDYNVTSGESKDTRYCHPQRDERHELSVLREQQCMYTAPCEPTWACVGNNTCSDGYTGDRCSQCVKGTHYRIGGECRKCPDRPWLIFVGMGVAAMVAGTVGYLLNRKGIKNVLIMICADTFQVLALFSNARIRWPPVLERFFQILSAFNLNVELAAPECIQPDVTYEQKFAATVLLPVVVVFLFFSVYLARLVYKMCCMSKGKEHLHAHAPQLISSLIILSRVCYLFVTQAALSTVSCLQTTPPDPQGVTYMDGLLDYPCWQPGSKQLTLFPFGMAAFLGYSIVLPLAMFWFVRQNKNSIKHDQILRAAGTGNDNKSKLYHFRKSWHQLYYPFKPGSSAWMIMVIARKFAIATIALVFRVSPTYQMSVLMLALFAAFVLQIRHEPFMSRGDHARVIAEHRVKVLSSIEHARIESEIQAMLEKNYKRTHKVDALLDTRSSSNNVGEQIVKYLLDYNQVEAFLLGCGILVCLAAVMLASSRFDPDQIDYYQNEYDAITWATVLILVVIVLYAMVVLMLDIYFGVAPDHAAATLQSCGCCKSIAERANAHDVAKTGKGGKKGAEMLHDDGDEDLQMASNPLMMQAMSSAGASASGVDASFSVDKLLQLEHPPPKEMWPSVRMWMSSMHGSVEQLKERLQQQQVDSARTADAGGSSAARSGGRRRANDSSRPKKRSFGQSSTRRGSLLVAKAGGGKGRSQRSLMSSLRAGVKKSPSGSVASPATSEEGMETNPLMAAATAGQGTGAEEGGAASPSAAGADSGAAMEEGMNPMARKLRRPRRAGLKAEGST